MRRAISLNAAAARRTSRGPVSANGGAADVAAQRFRRLGKARQMPHRSARRPQHHAHYDQRGQRADECRPRMRGERRAARAHDQIVVRGPRHHHRDGALFRQRDARRGRLPIFVRCASSSVGDFVGVSPRRLRQLGRRLYSATSESPAPTRPSAGAAAHRATRPPSKRSSATARSTTDDGVCAGGGNGLVVHPHRVRDQFHRDETGDDDPRDAGKLAHTVTPSWTRQ